VGAHGADEFWEMIAHVAMLGAERMQMLMPACHAQFPSPSCACVSSLTPGMMSRRHM
jgi:hypothetical protein